MYVIFKNGTPLNPTADPHTLGAGVLGGARAGPFQVALLALHGLRW